MNEQLGFLGNNCTRRDQTYTHPYASSSGNYHQHQQRQLPQRGMVGGYMSPHGGMRGFQSPQTVRDGRFGAMGGYPLFSYPPHFGIGGGLGRPPFGISPMGIQRYSPPNFGAGAGAFSRSHNPLFHRPRGYPAWPSIRHNMFSPSFLDDDDSDDDDEYSVPAVYRFPSRRRVPRGRYRRPIYGRQPRSSYWDDYDDGYDGFGAFCDEDDDDYEDYFPMTRPRRGF